VKFFPILQIYRFFLMITFRKTLAILIINFNCSLFILTSFHPSIARKGRNRTAIGKILQIVPNREVITKFPRDVFLVLLRNMITLSQDARKSAPKSKATVASGRKFYPFIFLLLNMSQYSRGSRVVNDWRIQNLDITPVLGRGYSMATGNLHSSCMVVQETTVPSYDYDYYFTEIKSSDQKSFNLAMSGKIKTSFGFFWARKTIEASFDLQSKSKRTEKTHSIIATMRTERYYSSVDETNSFLSNDAEDLLNNNEYISFMQACGPNYIRSVRRAAEITAIFTYTSTEKQSNTKFSNDIKGAVSGFMGAGGSSGSFSSDTEINRNSLSTKLDIKLRAYGLGLNLEGANSMVVQTMDEYKAVMDFAFKSMQQRDVGMVHGLEIVAWVDNPSFQVQARLSDTLQECETDEEESVNGNSSNGSGNATNGSTGNTLDGSTPVDENTSDPLQDDCKTIPTEIKKVNLISNGEHLATLNSVMRARMDMMYNAQSCRSMLYAFPYDQVGSELLDQRNTLFIGKSGAKVTVRDLRNKLDDKVMMKLQESTLNFVDKFYEPCVTELSKEFGGLVGGNAYATPWFAIKECQDVVCTIPTANVDDDGVCTIDLGEEETKDGTDIDPFATFPAAAATESGTLGQLSNLLQQYCMPILKEGSNI